MKSRYKVVLTHAQHQIDSGEDSYIPFKLFDYLMHLRQLPMMGLLDNFNDVDKSFGKFMLQLTRDIDELLYTFTIK